MNYGFIVDTDYLYSKAYIWRFDRPITNTLYVIKLYVFCTDGEQETQMQVVEEDDEGDNEERETHRAVADMQAVSININLCLILRRTNEKCTNIRYRLDLRKSGIGRPKKAVGLTLKRTGLNLPSLCKNQPVCVTASMSLQNYQGVPVEFVYAPTVEVPFKLNLIFSHQSLIYLIV